MKTETKQKIYIRIFLINAIQKHTRKRVLPFYFYPKAEGNVFGRLCVLLWHYIDQMRGILMIPTSIDVLILILNI